MFLFRFLSMMMGCVGILVRGENLEKFINMAASRGIYLWDIRRVSSNEILLKARLSAVRPLRHIGRRTGSRFSFRERQGLPFFISRLKRRKSILIGVVMFTAGLYILSSFIWSIDIKGNRQLSREAILEAAGEAGLKAGVVRFTVNQERVEEILMERFPEISYVGVKIEGTRAAVEIAEKTIMIRKEAQPADIVARKAGLIEEVLVLAGNAAVKRGDTVIEGQVLITGAVPPPDIPPPVAGDQGVEIKPAAPVAYVHARGIVRARVWYESYVEMPLRQETTRTTGRSVQRTCIKIGGREIIIKGSQKIPFILYERERSIKKPPSWRNIIAPVELITDTYLELQKEDQVWTRQEALVLAEREALARARSGITGEVRVIEENTREITVSAPENFVRVKGYIETLEDIGLEKLLPAP